MTKTATLAELILMAQSGRKFKAWKDGVKPFSHKYVDSISEFNINWITATWHYEEIKEPLKVSFECKWKVHMAAVYPEVDREHVGLSKFIGKKTRVTITEVLDDQD